MDTTWTRANLASSRKCGALTDVVRPTHEVLGRELALSLSAFLRTTIAVEYKDGTERSFEGRQCGESPRSAGTAIVRPLDQPVLVELEHSILYPLIGIALGAKPGSFTSPDRKPTDLELQVVNIIFRLVLSEAYRAWEPLLKQHLETATLDLDQAGSKAFQATAPVFVGRFELKLGENVGCLGLVTRPAFFAKAMAEEPAQVEASPERSSDKALDLLLPANVSLDVWLDGSQMSLQDLLQLREGQVVTLDHPVERKAVCTLNGKPGFSGQIVSTGLRRGFLVDDASATRP